MSLTGIPSGVQVFVDANILTYYFTGYEPFIEECSAFFERVASRNLRAITSADTAADVIHRVMIGEAIARLGLEPRSAVAQLKKHPEMVEQLHHFQSIPSDLASARIQIVDLTYRELHSSKQYREKYGLLTRDSIIVATMHRLNIMHLVTNDRDFERMPRIRVWLP
jgi:predicted nucleic acid-binding protein